MLYYCVTVLPAAYQQQQEEENEIELSFGQQCLDEEKF